MPFSKEIAKAAQVIQAGGHLLCPTNTVWGLSANATNIEAVERVFELKQRPKSKSMIVLVSSLEMLAAYVEEIPLFVLDFIKVQQHPCSIIYPKAKHLASNVVAENGSIAIRIVLNGFCHDLIEHLGFPIISTSANVSGEDSPKSFNDISDTIKEGVDFCVDVAKYDTGGSQVSSIYLIEGDALKKIR